MGIVTAARSVGLCLESSWRSGILHVVQVTFGALLEGLLGIESIESHLLTCPLEMNHISRADLRVYSNTNKSFVPISSLVTENQSSRDHTLTNKAHDDYTLLYQVIWPDHESKQETYIHDFLPCIQVSFSSHTRSFDRFLAPFQVDCFGFRRTTQQGDQSHQSQNQKSHHRVLM